MSTRRQSQHKSFLAFFLLFLYPIVFPYRGFQIVGSMGIQQTFGKFYSIKLYQCFATNQCHTIALIQECVQNEVQKLDNKVDQGVD